MGEIEEITKRRYVDWGKFENTLKPKEISISS